MTDPSAGNFSKANLRRGFQGELYSGPEYVGSVYLINGKGYVLDVECGQVKRVIGVHDPKSFRRIGRSEISESRYVQNWELV